MIIKRNPPGKAMRKGMRKSNENIMTPHMELPGMDLFTEIIPGNTPIKEGMYLIFYDAGLAESSVKKQASMGVANYSKGAWGTNYTVLAYLGPLPILSLPALKEYSPGYLINQVFYIATLEQAVKKEFTARMGTCYILCFLQPVLSDHFIFCYDSNDGIYPISKAYYHKKDKRWLWKVLSDKAVKKYLKRMEYLQNDC